MDKSDDGGGFGERDFPVSLLELLGHVDELWGGPHRGMGAAEVECSMRLRRTTPTQSERRVARTEDNETTLLIQLGVGA